MYNLLHFGLPILVGIIILVALLGVIEGLKKDTRKAFQTRNIFEYMCVL